jgi:hypothetical protein
VYTALLLAAGTCLAGGTPAFDGWDAGPYPYADPYACPSYGYDTYAPGPYVEPYFGDCGNPCWLNKPGYYPESCCHGMNCVERWCSKWHHRCDEPPPCCWGWDPAGGGPCFWGGGPPYGNCGWGSIVGAAKASGVWCPQECTPKGHGHPKHDCQPPCFDPSGGGW